MDDREYNFWCGIVSIFLFGLFIGFILGITISIYG